MKIFTSTETTVFAPLPPHGQARAVRHKLLMWKSAILPLCTVVWKGVRFPIFLYNKTQWWIFHRHEECWMVTWDTIFENTGHILSMRKDTQKDLKGLFAKNERRNLIRYRSLLILNLSVVYIRRKESKTTHI